MHLTSKQKIDWVRETAQESFPEKVNCIIEVAEAILEGVGQKSNWGTDYTWGMEYVEPGYKFYRLILKPGDEGYNQNLAPDWHYSEDKHDLVGLANQLIEIGKGFRSKRQMLSYVEKFFVEYAAYYSLEVIKGEKIPAAMSTMHVCIGEGEDTKMSADGIVRYWDCQIQRWQGNSIWYPFDESAISCRERSFAEGYAQSLENWMKEQPEFYKKKSGV